MEQMDEDVAIAWLDGRMRTFDGKFVGQKLFLMPAERRWKWAHGKGLDMIRTMLAEAPDRGPDGVDEAALDGVFLAVHTYAAQAGAWLGGDAWPTNIVTKATPPGLPKRDAEQVLLRDVASQAVSAEEVRSLVDTFVEATWGDPGRVTAAERQGFAGVAISAPPQFAAMQYTIGLLWGFALRGLVLRLALDRTLGTVPETPAAAQRRLERQFAASLGSEDQPQCQGAGVAEAVATHRKSPTLLEYATQFFGHRDWASLCQPTDATVAVLEGELEEALQGLTMLAGAEKDDYSDDHADPISRDIDNDDDGDEDEMEDDDGTVTLTLRDWESFQRRAVALGALLADAEALVDSEVGPLPRGLRRATMWVTDLIQSGALSSVRQEHGSMLKARLVSPAHRLAEVLRKHLLPSKLQSARRQLNQLLGSDGAPDFPDPTPRPSPSKEGEQ